MNIERLAQNFAVEAAKAQAEIRKGNNAIVTNINAAKLALHDELEAVEEARAELSRRVERAWEVFDRALMEEAASLIATNQKLGEPSNVTALPSKQAS